MTRTRTIAIVLAVVLAIGLAGCGALSADSNDGGTDVDPSNYSAESLQQEAQASMEAVDSLTLEMNIDMDIEGPMSSGSMSIEGEGAANYGTERMHFESLEVDLSTPRGDRSASGEAYQVGSTMYVNDGTGWNSQPADDTTWSQDTATQQTDLLEDAEVSIEGAESVNGQDALVVSVAPSDAALEEMAGSTAGSGSTSANSMEIESATVTQYIAAEEPHYVLKSEVEMVVVGSQGEEVDMTMTVTMDDHGEDVTIDVPDDVR